MEQPPAESSSSSSSSDVASASRKKACGNCVRRRSRCDGLTPCDACRLHNTQASCARPNQGAVEAASQNPRACHNCFMRKSKCDRAVPCAKCVSLGKQSSCYAELGSHRRRNSAAAGVPRSSTDDIGDGVQRRQQHHSSRACFNCWYRKNKCDKGKPCSSCAFHGSDATCYSELDKEHYSAHSNHEHRMMKTKRQQQRASAKATKGKQRATSSSSSSSSSGGRDYILVLDNEAQGAPTEHASMLADAIERLPPLAELTSIIALIGNCRLANDWPSVDHTVLHSVCDMLKLRGMPDALELAYVYALLAVCSVALPLLHPLKLTGAHLHPSMRQWYVSAATTLFDQCTDTASGAPTMPILECRLFHALAWSALYSGRSMDAHYFSEQSVLSAQMANILHRADDASVCALVKEVSSLASWISFAADAPSSMPPLPTEKTVDQALPTLSAKWQAWKVHSSGWMGKALLYLRQVNAKQPDGALVWSPAQRDAYALQLLEQMQLDERDIDARTTLLLGVDAPADVMSSPLLEDALQMRYANAIVAAQLTVLILRDMLTAHTFLAERLDARLSQTALRSAGEIVTKMPMLLSLFNSQYDFPPLRLFLRRIFDSSMQTTYNAICRLHDVQKDPTAAAQTAWLIRAAPSMYQMMNQRGAAGPSALAVLSTCRSLPVHRAPKMVLDAAQTDDTPEHDERIN